MSSTTEDTVYAVALIGTGRPRTEGEDYTGWGMSHAHARGYNATGKCRIVALCDIVPLRAEKFNREHADGTARLFTDYQEMLRDARPDLVSVCTWPHLHAPMVIAAAEAGVRAIHCEKPMAPTWGEAKRMKAACDAHGVQLTFDHQRRFLDAFQAAKRVLDEGRLGDLKRLEASCPNLFDWGTHWLNMFSFFNDEVPGKWVMGQVDARGPKAVYGVPTETHGLCTVLYENNVLGMMITGEGAEAAVGCAIRLIGTEGTLELHNSAPSLRLRGRGDAAWHTPEDLQNVGGLHGDIAITRAIADMVDCVGSGKTPLLSADNAYKTTEVIYATYESARRRGRVDLPLEIEDHPFVEMRDAGVFPHAVAEPTAAAAMRDAVRR